MNPIPHGLLIAALAVGAIPAAAQAQASKPNIVFILADDLGYADLKCYGHPYARTPNLDQLAAEGTRFTQVYMTGITCCPSRTGLMTGKFPATFREYPASAGFGNRVTVTELLKQSGYTTGHFGKWHIGAQETPGTYGIDAINVTPGEGARRREDERGRDANIFDDAIGFIEKHKQGPFYVNVWGHISHFPITPPPALLERFDDLTVNEGDFSAAMRQKFADVRKSGGDVNTGMRRYLADVESMDAAVGRLLKSLDALGLRENTIVVFSSDQGPAPVRPPAKANALAPAAKRQRIEAQANMLGYAGEARGGKHGMYEGGVRVPFIIRWPGRVPANRVNTSSVIGGIDWLPTLCRIAGAGFDAAAFDGEDVSEVWLGQDRKRTRPLFWKTNNVRSDIAIRDGDWKLFYTVRNRGETELYDLSVDRAETTNVATRHPDVVKRLTAKVEKWKATLPAEYVKTDDKD
jgi:N-acetylgalactosamine-6-sulfatase